MADIVPFSPAQAGEVMEQVLIRGDLAGLTNAERARYYVRVCQSLGINPLTRPFDYILLNNKLTLYALKGCTDQLRAIHGISASIVGQTEANGLLTVHVRVRDQSGREDEDLGVVTLPEKGDARANAIMKAITKAKRRATLSLCGLGMLDETELETIPPHAKQAPAVSPTMLQLEKPAVSENSTAAENPESVSAPDPVPAKLPARIQRNLDRLKPKPGGISERAMIARGVQSLTVTEAAKAINRQLHPFNDELPGDLGPPKPLDRSERDGVPSFLDRRKAAVESEDPAAFLRAVE